MRKPYLLVMAAAMCACSTKIDREDLVRRNNPIVNDMDTLASLSVGNGHFAFTVDATGLQTFADEYAAGVPLCTMSDWGWHSYANSDSLRPEEAWEEMELFGHKGLYATESREPGRHHDAASYYRANPHRLNLGTLGFALTNDTARATMSDITDIEQSLDMWEGVINSSFKYAGETSKVTTICSPNQDAVSVAVESRLLSQGKMDIELRLPYPTGQHSDNASNYQADDKHESDIVEKNEGCAIIRHTIDTTTYYIAMTWNGRAKLEKRGAHTYAITPTEGDKLEVVCLFSEKAEYAKQEDIATASAKYWNNYWMKGGVVDFSKCADARAREIERRVVLSQYLCAVNCAGNMPPQESGLTYNTWFGRPHLEMYWWHGLHFALYGHEDLLERGLDWYSNAFDDAKKIAERQGYEGARWMKMTDPWAGEAPSKVGSFLIWQQPHYIYLCEEMYKCKPTAETLEKYGQMVDATAEFMASFATYDSVNGRYNLEGVIPAQETLRAKETINPPLELTYWCYGLRTAQKWRERMGRERVALWDSVADNIAALAHKDSLYLAAETATDTYTNIKYISDHPAVLGAYGMLPPLASTDKEMMQKTLDWIWDNWNWDKTWGWDYPLTAMAAARLGDKEKAVDALLMDKQTNTYLINGHNYQDKRLRIYLPGNGGILAAVAMMSAGWSGSEGNNPGWPDNWDVRWEGLRAME